MDAVLKDLDQLWEPLRERPPFDEVVDAELVGRTAGVVPLTPQDVRKAFPEQGFDAPLGVLEALRLARPAVDRGSTLVLDGPRGNGKSARLALAVLDERQVEDGRVVVFLPSLRTWCTQAKQTFDVGGGRYATLGLDAALLRWLDTAHGSRLRHMGDEALAKAMDDGLNADTSVDPLAVHKAAVTVLERLATRSPADVLWAVDEANCLAGPTTYLHPAGKGKTRLHAQEVDLLARISDAALAAETASVLATSHSTMHPARLVKDLALPKDANVVKCKLSVEDWYTLAAFQGLRMDDGVRAVLHRLWHSHGGDARAMLDEIALGLHTSQWFDMPDVARVRVQARHRRKEIQDAKAKERKRFRELARE